MNFKQVRGRDLHNIQVGPLNLNHLTVAKVPLLRLVNTSKQFPIILEY